MLSSVVHLIETVKSSLQKLRQGEEVTRIALLLALISLVSAGMTGCTRPTAPVVVQRRVRVGTLLPVHPLWSQVVALDRTIARLRLPVGSSSSLGSALSPLPPTLASPPSVPPTVMAMRRRRTQDFESDYLRDLAETLRMKDEAYLAQSAKREEKDAEAAYRRELAERVTSIRSDQIRQAEVLDREISRLKFRDVPFQVQMNVYKGQAAQDARIQHDLLISQIDKLTHDAEALVSPTNISDLAANALKGRRQALINAGAERVSQMGVQLAMKRADTIRTEQGKLTYGVEPVTPISRITLPDPGPEQAPLALSPLQIEASALDSASGAVGLSVGAQTRVWQDQRNGLIQVIRADTELAVQQIAARQGWTIVPDTGSNGAGLVDVTDEVKSLLIAQWRQP